jgi:predicted membrane-bound spermidine synthase
MVGVIAGAEGVAVRLVTFMPAVELVKVSLVPEAALVDQAEAVPAVKEPPVRSPRVLVAVRLLIT